MDRLLFKLWIYIKFKLINICHLKFENLKLHVKSTFLVSIESSNYKLSIDMLEHLIACLFDLVISIFISVWPEKCEQKNFL